MRKCAVFAFLLLFIFAMGSCSARKTDDTQKEELEMSMTADEIWKIEDTNDFVLAFVDRVLEKSEYGSHMDKLSDCERVFYITQTCEMEVNNGGFSQFFYNSSGDFSNELVQSFQDIGAVKTAEICQKALGAFERELPVDRMEREELLDELMSDEVERILDECDTAFYRYEENLNALNYAYIWENKADFS